MKHIGLATILAAVDRGLKKAWPAAEDQQEWPKDLNLQTSTVEFGNREATVMIDTGLDVFRIDIKHVQRRQKAEGQANETGQSRRD